MKRKVLLLTWYGNNNYGTSLQAYSLKTIIENPEITNLDISKNINFNAECEILPHTPNRMKKRFHKIRKLFELKVYKEKWNQLQDKKIYNKKKNLFLRREKLFKNFTKNNFKFASNKNIQTEEQLNRIQKKYDIFISGSDQIWNPEALDPTYLLKWVENGKKKFSYGSSLSVKTIPREYFNIYKNALVSFESISIRDSACREQLSKIIGKKVTTVVDPVILIGAAALRKNIKTIENKNYEFCYFLGNNENHRKCAINFAKKKNLPIKAVIHTGSGFFADKLLEPYADWEVGPWDFVSYINSSQIVFTDSFHATVISVLLHKDFIVFEKNSQRPEQNNRIKEFLKLVNLESQWKSSSQEIKDVKISKEQWNMADKALEESRKKSFEFLMEAFK